jgi:uroporphyrin-III C-methyltransferase
MKRLSKVHQPSITLVGAGPGDPELLTLKAVKAIASATVLLVDDLVSNEILAYASSCARVIHVGKRGGCQSTPQAFIQRLMLQEASKGEIVVRLKGGDPFLFGRGGEEVEYLQKHGVNVQVINGITAGLAGVSSLGISLTHRDHAHGVVFITGHSKQNEKEPIDWGALSHTANQAKLTLVIYMGISSAAKLQSRLLVGLKPSTPVAVIQDVSLPLQRHVVCTLSLLNNTVINHQMISPSIIIVGDVLLGLTQIQSSQKHLRALV